MHLQGLGKASDTLQAFLCCISEWNWLRIPQSYQDSCYLSADTTAVQQYINPTKEHESYSDVVVSEADCDYTSPCLPHIPK